jgi:hypothetical protein
MIAEEKQMTFSGVFLFYVFPSITTTIYPALAELSGTTAGNNA